MRINDKRNPVNTDCVICSLSMGDQSKQNVMTICKHFYHYQCLKDWVAINPTCPLCRKSINFDNCVSNQNQTRYVLNVIRNMSRNFYHSVIESCDDDNYYYMQHHRLLLDNYMLSYELSNIRNGGGSRDYQTNDYYTNYQPRSITTRTLTTRNSNNYFNCY